MADRDKQVLGLACLGRSSRNRIETELNTKIIGRTTAWQPLSECTHAKSLIHVVIRPSRPRSIWSVAQWDGRSCPQVLLLVRLRRLSCVTATLIVTSVKA